MSSFYNGIFRVLTILIIGVVKPKHAYRGDKLNIFIIIFVLCFVTAHLWCKSLDNFPGTQTTALEEEIEKTMIYKCAYKFIDKRLIFFFF